MINHSFVILICFASVIVTIHMLVARPSYPVLELNTVENAAHPNDKSLFLSIDFASRPHLKQGSLDKCSSLSKITQQTYIFRFNMGKYYSYETYHWFHIAEHITSLHAQVQSLISPTATDVVLVFEDEHHFSLMSPYTRLLAMLGLASTSVRRLHFVLGTVSANTRYSVAEISARQSFVVDLDTQPRADRFVVSASDSSEVVECGVWVGDVGFDRVPRDRWFPSDVELNSFRDLTRHLCSISPEATTSTSSSSSNNNNNNNQNAGSSAKQDLVMIYQRDQSRVLLHSDELLNRLSDFVSSHELENEFKVVVWMHNNDYPPCDLVQTLSQVRVFVSPHGFQCMLTLFLPEHASMYEIFPAKYRWFGYQIIADGMHIRHHYETSKMTNAASECIGKSPFACGLQGHAAYSLLAMRNAMLSMIPTTTCRKWHICRSIARSADTVWSEKTVWAVEGEIEYQAQERSNTRHHITATKSSEVKRIRTSLSGFGTSCSIHS